MRTKSTLKMTLAALAAALSVGSALAQSSTTPTIGYYKQTFVDPGLYPIVPGFVNRTEFQGQASVTPVTTGTNLLITQTGAGWTAGQFTTGAYYVEVLSDGNVAHAGLILDITVSATASVTVTVPSGFAAGANFQYLIRKHVTLGSVLGNGSGVNDLDGDGAILIDVAGNPFNATYIGSGNWVSSENPAVSLTNSVLYPGQGLIFFPAGANRTITIGGGETSYVKTGPTQFSLPASVVALVGLINPLVPSSPSDPIYATTGRATLAEIGLQSLLSEADSDLAQVFSRDGLLTGLGVIKVGSDLIEPENNANMNNYKIDNGESFLLLPGADKALTLPQRF